MNNYITVDSIIFIISNLLLAIYVFKNKNLNFKEKIAYTIFFIILNSSYNIMFVRIHQNNTVIPRTYIYKKKFIGPLTLLDIICLGFIFMNLKRFFIIIKDKFIAAHIIRALGIYILGTFAFIIFNGYWLDNGNRFLIVSKGWVYSLATLIFTYKYLNKNINLLYPFSIILINGMISTQIVPITEIWIRYGHRVTILDQEDAYTISNFVVIFLTIKCLYLKENNKLHKIINFLLLFFFLFQNLYCVYKTNLIILLAFFVIYLILSKGKNGIILITTFIGIPSGIIIFWNKIYGLISSVSINTRQNQFLDCLQYMNTKGWIANLFGLGISTPYYSTFVGDSGERKSIDLANNLYAQNWRTDLQTPILSIFKDSGIFGMICFAIFTVYLLSKNWKMLKNVFAQKNKEYIFTETVALGIVILIETAYSIFFYCGTVTFAIFYTFCLAKFVINYKKMIKV